MFQNLLLNYCPVSFYSSVAFCRIWICLKALALPVSIRALRASVVSRFLGVVLASVLSLSGKEHYTKVAVF